MIVNMEYEQLKLGNQVCFPIYAASRLITRAYQPLLDQLDLTYPQYLVMMVLWENDQVSVNTITDKLILNTNTVTPLLKRMEVLGLITRKRSETDERSRTISLTEKGLKLREQAALVPMQLAEKLDVGELNIDEIIDLRDKLNRLIEAIKN
ncbi:MarR family winged helix-turn-helix transcriptional regulator [Maribellus sediminis]|uniref:MarR family winged helix-turn-helix transcriptional regulator n=1 Tax=Maribellus sediminis TaxID=2696285 RepID=UPI001981B983|nr:MarR family transcriptional regulator [Maribellus sediminis]